MWPQYVQCLEEMRKRANYLTDPAEILTGDLPKKNRKLYRRNQVFWFELLRRRHHMLRMSNMKERVWSPESLTPTCPSATLPINNLTRTGLGPATNRLEPSCSAVKDEEISGFPFCSPPGLETKTRQCLWQSTVVRIIN
jgi:hypothetical protein